MSDHEPPVPPDSFPAPEPYGAAQAPAPAPRGRYGRFPARPANPTVPSYGGYNSPYGTWRMPDSTAMGTWALVLAFLACVPFGWLVSLGLAIATLVRSRDGRDFGRTRAFVALGVDAGWAAAFVVLVVLAAMGVIGEPDRDASGHVTTANRTTVDQLRVGDCFDEAGDAPTGR
jgi:hypothetical protein